MERILEIVRRMWIVLMRHWRRIRPYLMDPRVLIGVGAFFLGQISTPPLSPAYNRFYRTLSTWSRPVVRRIHEPAVELGGIDGIVYRLRGCSELGEELFEELREVHARIETELGPPLFRGEIEIHFDPGIGGDAEVAGSWWRRRRYVRFPRSDTKPDRSLIVHELVHALWQTEEFMKNSPLAAVEGIAVALSQIVTGDSDSLLLPGLEAFYLSDLEGFVHPERPFERTRTKQLEYALSGLFFRQLHEIDSTLLAQILRQPSRTRTKWNEFAQRLVDLSAHPTSVRSFVSRCRLFSSFPARSFVIPAKSADPTVINLVMAVENWDGKAEITCRRSLNGEQYQASWGTFFNAGFAELSLILPGEEMPNEIIVEGRLAGDRFEQHILFEGGDEKAGNPNPFNGERPMALADRGSDDGGNGRLDRVSSTGAGRSSSARPGDQQSERHRS